MAYSHEPKSEHVHHLVSSKYIESLMSVGRVVLRRVFRAICFKSLENWTRANAAATMCDTGTLSVPVDQVRVKTNVVLCCRIRRGCVACENNHSIYIQGVYQGLFNFVGPSNAVHPVWSVQMDVRIYIYVHVWLHHLLFRVRDHHLLISWVISCPTLCWVSNYTVHRR